MVRGSHDLASTMRPYWATVIILLSVVWAQGCSSSTEGASSVAPLLEDSTAEDSSYDLVARDVGEVDGPDVVAADVLGEADAMPLDPCGGCPEGYVCLETLTCAFVECDDGNEEAHDGCDGYELDEVSFTWGMPGSSATAPARGGGFWMVWIDMALTGFDSNLLMAQRFLGDGRPLGSSVALAWLTELPWDESMVVETAGGTLALLDRTGTIVLADSLGQHEAVIMEAVVGLPTFSKVSWTCLPDDTCLGFWPEDGGDEQEAIVHCTKVDLEAGTILDSLDLTPGLLHVESLAVAPRSDGSILLAMTATNGQSFYEGTILKSWKTHLEVHAWVLDPAAQATSAPSALSETTLGSTLRLMQVSPMTDDGGIVIWDEDDKIDGTMVHFDPLVRRVANDGEPIGEEYALAGIDGSLSLLPQGGIFALQIETLGSSVATDSTDFEEPVVSELGATWFDQSGTIVRGPEQLVVLADGSVLSGQEVDANGTVALFFERKVYYNWFDLSARFLSPHGDFTFGGGCEQGGDCSGMGCPCDTEPDVCDTDGPCSLLPCSCDVLCTSQGPCEADGVCLPACATGADPDCSGSSLDGLYCSECGIDLDCVDGCATVDRSDPDCSVCMCDYQAGICESNGHFLSPGSALRCPCDDDCVDGAVACQGDTYCDPGCPDGVDPDCAVICIDSEPFVCEVLVPCSLVSIPCDPDCTTNGLAPCADDGYCDKLCPMGGDPDCAGTQYDGKWCD